MYFGWPLSSKGREQSEPGIVEILGEEKRSTVNEEECRVKKINLFLIVGLRVWLVRFSIVLRTGKLLMPTFHIGSP